MKILTPSWDRTKQKVWGIHWWHWPASSFKLKKTWSVVYSSTWRERVLSIFHEDLDQIDSIWLSTLGHWWVYLYGMVLLSTTTYQVSSSLLNSLYYRRFHRLPWDLSESVKCQWVIALQYVLVQETECECSIGDNNLVFQVTNRTLRCILLFVVICFPFIFDLDYQLVVVLRVRVSLWPQARILLSRLL